MKRVTVTTAIAAAVLALSLPGIAESQEPATAQAAPEVKELLGQGSEDCPSMSLCLYEDVSLNKGKDARVWVFPITEARTDHPLRNHAARDKPSSAYMRAPNLGWTAYLFTDNDQCGYAGNRETEGLSFRRNNPYNSLNSQSGQAKRYGYFYKNGKWSKSKRWGVTTTTLHLNDRAGCVSLGAYKNTDALRPYDSGDM
ncbi:hypothetical protein OHS59_00190 [Streptomyces sp. NBC_00414]|uniref:hypothetical protein n=1 Tax=Streptomyces sp. NBC_00414 TaxID=2975739 RepID=UPI002E1EEE61